GQSGAAEDVAAADHQRDFGSGLLGLDDLARQPPQHFRVDAVVLVPHQRFAGQLEQDAAEGEGHGGLRIGYRHKCKRKSPGLPGLVRSAAGWPQARPACFMTSAWKSSACFSMPSPTARRTNCSTCAPVALSTCSTDWLVSMT